MVRAGTLLRGGMRRSLRTHLPSIIGAVCAAVLLVSLSPAAQGGDRIPQEPMTLVREAFLAAENGLKSGKGKGSRRLYLPDGTLRDDLGFEVAFQGDKFNLELDYRKWPASFMPADRKIIVSDGSAIFVTTFSERLHPVGCETRVYGADEVAQALGSFGYNLARLPQRLLDLEQLEKYAPAFEELPSGRYRCKFDPTDKFQLTLEFAPEYGYNVAMREGRRNFGKPTYTRYTATWKEAKGVWYIDRLDREEWLEGELYGRIKLWYDEFEVNPPVAAKLFTLDSLQMREESRLIDERRGSPVKVRRIPPTAETVQKRLDTMISQAESLPPLYPQTRDSVEEEGTSSAMWIAASVFGLIALVAIVAVLRLKGFGKPRNR